MSTVTAPFAPFAAATGESVALAMQRLWLTGEITPAGARLHVEHIFRSEEKSPLEVVYAFPLPRDAALRSFRITGEGFEAHSELQPAEEAVRKYEEGVAAGALAALARAYGDGVVNLTVGNVRPHETVTVSLEILAGVELSDEGFRFRFPFTLSPRYHSGARAVVNAAGEGEMELPSDQFGDVMLPPVRKDASGLHQVGFDVSVVTAGEVDEVASPSHGVRVRRADASRARVSLAAADVPDRDLVLDVHYAAARAQVIAAPAGNGRTQFVAIIPSTAFGENPAVPRTVVFLLDRSGSMQGAPITQARKALEACMALLSDEDRFGIVAFDDRVETLDGALLPGTRENRDRAHSFLSHVEARGGTELAGGVKAAAAVLRRAGADVLILTDGQVAGTEEILETARSAGMRLHCLGIGSASQDRFLTLLARETGGVSRFVTARERVDLSAVNLFASVGRPIATDLKADPAVEPEPPSAVFAGTPVALFGETDRETTEFTLEWPGGRIALPLIREEQGSGDTLRLLRGSRLITDCEGRYPAAEALAPTDKRKQSRVAARLVSLSQEYGLASREMSLVVVVHRAGDRPGEIPETRVVPVGMPQDVDFGAYFPRPAILANMAAAPVMSCDATCAFQALVTGRRTRKRVAMEAFAAPLSSAPVEEDVLMELASRIEPDGGMPGGSPEERAGASAVALLAFVSHGQTPRVGVFRMHVARLIAFLERFTPPEHDEIVAAVIAASRRGRVPAGDWVTLTQTGADPWPQLAAAFATM